MKDKFISKKETNNYFKENYNLVKENYYKNYDLFEGIYNQFYVLILSNGENYKSISLDRELLIPRKACTKEAGFYDNDEGNQVWEEEEQIPEYTKKDIKKALKEAIEELKISLKKYGN